MFLRLNKNTFFSYANDIKPIAAETRTAATTEGEVTTAAEWGEEAGGVAAAALNPEKLSDGRVSPVL